MNRDPDDFLDNSFDCLDELLVDDLCAYETKHYQGDVGQPESSLEADVPEELRSRFEEYCRCVDVLNLARTDVTFRLSDSDDGEIPQKPVPQGAEVFADPRANISDGRPSVRRPPRIGRFEIVEQLGTGGHGIVFRAIDPVVRREVAIKVPRPELLGSMKQVTRFARETSIVGMLEHPNIVPIYESDCHGTVPYIVMPYVPGQTLAEWRAAKTSVPPRLAAEIVRQLALAVSHAHERGVLHRDLKPGNVLLAPLDSNSAPQSDGPGVSLVTGPVQLEFVPKLTDFGSAKCDDIDTALTQTGATIGTAVYMSPEQAEGRVRDITAQTDVYGLGVILYELLTGQPPFRGNNEPQTLQKILQNDAPSFESCRVDVPLNLAVICLKCLEKSPAKRYGSAKALSEDLQCFLNGDSISARPASIPVRVVKWCRRHPFFSVAMGTVLLGALTITSISLYYNSRLVEQLNIAETSRRIARRHEEHAIQSEEVSRRRSYVSDMRNAKMSWDRGDVRQMLKVLERHSPLNGKPDIRDFAWWYLWREYHDSSQILGTHELRTTTVAITRAGDMAASGGSEGIIKLWSLPTGKLAAELRGHAPKTDIESLDFSPNGARLVSAGRDGTVRIWDVTAGKELFVRGEHHSEVSCAAYSPRGDLIASGGADGNVRLWDSDSGTPLGFFQGHAKPVEDSTGQSTKVRCLAFHPSDPLLVTGGLDGTIRFWTLNDNPSGPRLTEKAFHNLGEEKHPRAFAFEPNGNSLIAASIACEVVQISVLKHNFAEVIRRTPEEAQPRTVIWPSEDNWIVGLRTSQIRLADARSPETTLMTLKGHFETVLSIAISADGKNLVSGSKDGSVRYWPNFRERTQIQVAAAESDSTSAKITYESVQWSRQHLAATDSLKRTVSIFRMPERKFERAIPKDESDDYLISPSGQYLLFANPDGLLTYVRAHDGEVLWSHRLVGNPWNVRGCDQIAMDESDKWAAVPDWRSLLILSLPNSQIQHRFEHPAEVRQVRILTRSDNSPIAMTTSRDNILRFWDLQTGRLFKEHPLGTADDPIFLVTSGDYRLLAIGSVEQRIRVWDLDAMTEVASISTNSKDLRTTSTLFLGGSKFLICPHSGLTLWNIHEDAESIAFPEFPDRGRGRKFATSPYGNQFAVCLHGVIHIIDGRSPEQLKSELVQ